ncbi:MAG: hypothetical protein M3065_09995 [Actinomycetota bacterium]|nr:hypothetical protein [Actinomycetota bacterium]
MSRLESGAHTPSLATLQKIAAVPDEELLVCFQRTGAATAWLIAL